MLRGGERESNLYCAPSMPGVGAGGVFCRSPTCRECFLFVLGKRGGKCLFPREVPYVADGLTVAFRGKQLQKNIALEV